MTYAMSDTYGIVVKPNKKNMYTLYNSDYGQAIVLHVDAKQRLLSLHYMDIRTQQVSQSEFCVIENATERIHEDGVGAIFNVVNDDTAEKLTVDVLIFNKSATKREKFYGVVFIKPRIPTGW
jgi:hypothetical protein